MTTALPVATPAASTVSPTDVGAIPKLNHAEAMGLAKTEFARMIDLLAQLTLGEWQLSTVCPLWNVQEMTAHIVGMAEAQASFRHRAGRRLVVRR